MSELNFAFFGTPEVASNTLEILKQAGHLPTLIITSPDARAGRGMKLQESPAAIFAKENNIPCLKPEKLTPSVFDTSPLLKGEDKGGGYEFDLFIVVAYGKIIPENILNLPRFGSINVHYSLLPKYRGASPVESAILNGETKTGATIQKMVYQMDAGPILAQKEVEIMPDETAPELRERLIKIGGEMLVKILETPSGSPLSGGEIQDESGATYCKKIKKEDGLVDLVAEPPSVLYNKFRAYANWPRTFFFKNDKRVIITDAALENGEFKIKKVLPEGRRETSWEEFKRQF